MLALSTPAAGTAERTRGDVASAAESRGRAVAEPPLPGRRARAASIAVLAVALAAVPAALALHYDYLPIDDCLRHAAYAVSGRDWSDILVQRSSLTLDKADGWHRLLRLVHVALGADARELVLFSYAGLFLLALATPLFYARWPEAWGAALLLAALTLPDRFPDRMLRGRPYLVPVAVLLVLLRTWAPPGRPSARRLAATTAALAAAAWMHGSWFLWGLVVLAFLLAGRWRQGVWLTACVLAACLLAAALTGRPLAYLSEQLWYPLIAFGNGASARELVGEFRPYHGGAPFLLALLAVTLLVRRRTGQWWRPEVSRLPAVLGALGWLGGLAVYRFFGEWGMPALLTLMAAQLEALLDTAPAPLAGRRVALAAVIGLGLFAAAAANLGGRWSKRLPCQADPAAQADGFFPGRGGLIYSPDMDVFLCTFFRYPSGPWRYLYGYESGMMNDADLQVLRSIQRSNYDWRAFRPWVARLRPEDRLFLLRSEEPDLPELEWRRSAGLWLGRPRGAAVEAPP